MSNILTHNTIPRHETRTWLSPIAVVTIAEPRPVVTLTLIPPIILHTMMYHSMLFLPYLQEHSHHDCCSPSLDQTTHLGANQNTMTKEAAMSMEPYTRKPGDKNSF